MVMQAARLKQNAPYYFIVMYARHSTTIYGTEKSRLNQQRSFGA
jgi:hypothetical protein